jgi:PHD/YefM family antitoxin component YafN of YafNO toxin-antitoxin module
MYIPVIRPITDLKKTAEIAALCHESGQPVFITKNGCSDLVIMSMETYAQRMFAADVAEKLDVAEEQLQAGAQGLSHEQIIARQRGKLRGSV